MVKICKEASKSLDRYLDSLENKRSGIYRYKADRIYHSAIAKVETLVKLTEKMQEEE